MICPKCKSKKVGEDYPLPPPYGPCLLTCLECGYEWEIR